MLSEHVQQQALQLFRQLDGVRQLTFRQCMAWADAEEVPRAASMADLIFGSCGQHTPRRLLHEGEGEGEGCLLPG